MICRYLGYQPIEVLVWLGVALLGSRRCPEGVWTLVNWGMVGVEKNGRTGFHEQQLWSGKIQSMWEPILLLLYCYCELLKAIEISASWIWEENYFEDSTPTTFFAKILCTRANERQVEFVCFSRVRSEQRRRTVETSSHQVTSSWGPSGK